MFTQVLVKRLDGDRVAGMKPTKAELALGAERMKIHSACCWLLKYQSLYKEGALQVSTAKALHELSVLMGPQKLDDLLRFMDTLP